MSEHTPAAGHAKPARGTPGRLCGKGVRVGRPAIDTDDFDALREAAHRLANGSRREVMALSEIEQRALLKLAAIGADVIWLASDLVVLSDAGAGRAAITKKLEELADFVRPLVGETQDA